MANVVCLTYNPFQENTYLVYDETSECIVFDPGCYSDQERDHFKGIISEKGLKVVQLINTHCHLDHVFGNRFIVDTYKTGLEMHEGELPVYEAVPQVSAFYGVPFQDELPAPTRFIKEGDVITFGNTELKAILTPGHSPASLSFFCEADQFLIAGDVLFYESIGRTDLPGGDMATLLKSIKDKLFPLGDAVKVYPGHGPATTIGHERIHNPFTG